MRELMSWDPFREAFPRLLGRSSGGSLAFVPAFDVRESKDRYVFQADLPGFRDEDVDISLNGNRLTIAGKREAEQVERSDTFYCSERSHGSFARSFTLPEGVNADQIDAELRDGILSVHVPKVPEAQPRRIELQGRGNAGGANKAGGTGEFVSKGRETDESQVP
jgi:HSP20 family protein